MSYKITFRKKVVKEYLHAIAWYKERSPSAAENFVRLFQQRLDEIEMQPDYFRNSYKHFHETKIRRYPYNVVYFIDESKKIIVVTTLFHQKRNPRKKFR
jgi:plasmid stabilization system protein ParE